MQKTSELLPGCRFRITYTYDYAEAYPVAYKIASSVRFPGFRKGHAPFGLVVRSYGMDILFDSAFDRLRPGRELYRDLVEEGHSSSFQPTVTLKPVKKDEPVVYECVWSIEPQIEIGEYQGTKLLIPEEKATDEMVEERIKLELRKQTSFSNVTDRPCRSGEMVTVDFAGTIDGVEVEGTSGSDVSFRIGERRYLPDLEDGIVGMSVDEEKDIQVLFPEDYGNKDLAGKTVTFHVKLKAIVEENVPELDDDFVQDVSDFDTVEEYREDMRRVLEKEVEQKNKTEFVNRIMDHVIGLSKVELSSEMIDAQTEVNYQNAVDQYAQQGLNYEDMLRESGLGKQFAVSMAREQAIKQLTDYCVTAELINKLNISATDEDINALLEESRETLGARYDEYVSNLTEDMKETLRHECEIRKLAETLREDLDVSFVAPDDPALNPPVPEAAAAEADEAAPAEDGKE